MQIQVNSDKNITADARLIAFVEGEVNRSLKRFARRLTRVEVHLSDENSHKFGVLDKRCRVEARPAGHRPLAASNGASTVENALLGALTKLRNSMETVFGRIEARRTSAKPARAQREAARPKATPKVAAAGASSAVQPEATEPAPEIGRGPKKKQIYQARRKSWPRR